MPEAIPISTAKTVAKRYLYDQVIIYARTVGDDGIEHVTTYGKDRLHCGAAARIGDALLRQVVRPIEERDEALRLALPLLEEDRKAFFECQTVCDDPATLEPDDRAIIERYDAAIAAIRTALGGNANG